MRREQREGIGADRVEGDVAEIEQAGEADHDVEAEAEHHIGQHQDGKIEQIAQRQIEIEGGVENVGDDREQGRRDDEADAAILRAVGRDIGDRPCRKPSLEARRFPGAVPPEQIEQQPAGEDDADRGGEQHRARLEGETAGAVDGLHPERQGEQGEGDERRERRVDQG